MLSVITNLFLCEPLAPIRFDSRMREKRTVAFSKNATNVFFHILTRCNLKCRHCYIDPVQHGKETVPIETIRRWLGAFPVEDRQANLVFLGGEPTLHPGLPEAIRAARELGYGSVTVDTNGYLFNDFLEKTDPGDLDYISFSLDGAVPETNDAIRGSGCYDACVSGAGKAAEAGFATSMIYTVSAANIHELTMMDAVASSLDIRRFFIQVIGIRGRSAKGGGGNLQVSPEQWLSVVPKAAEKIADTGVTVTYPKVFLEPDETFQCAGLVADNHFIFPNGRVYRCPLCEDFPIHGHAFENDRLAPMPPVNETDLFPLSIPEGCVLNRIVQPGNLRYREDGSPAYRIACCMLKEEITGELG